MGNMNMQEMMNNPMVKEMMNNPEFMKQAMSFAQNPNDMSPDKIKQMVEMMQTNPMMKEMLQK